MLPWTISAITPEAIGLETFSNPLKMRKVFYFRFLKMGSFGFEFFVGCVIIRVGLGLFGALHLALSLNFKSERFILFKRQLKKTT